jgi:hypothetical protein
MTDQSADLVTKIDVIPDLDGLNSFDAAIDKAIAKVNQLDAAIKRVNNLKPASPYAPSSASTAPTAAATAAIATVAATGTNLIARTPLAETVRRESQKVARAAVQGMGNGIGLLFWAVAVLVAEVCYCRRRVLVVLTRSTRPIFPASR